MDKSFANISNIILPTKLCHYLICTPKAEKQGVDAIFWR